ncbi:TonB-dependent receptor [Photobacterium sanctipauli]|uniref:TonB-dependent receptor n=1 Tax=Photobacterium sanctipauli TaxID=1342794 RepID=A0A2T3P0N9_9GAMM|nr:TonB-dependent receptor [Photobacterium sanctipauli]PSW22070.1 TonB-dependent receptor [Photobacterium sanctipauli]
MKKIIPLSSIFLIPLANAQQPIEVDDVIVTTATASQSATVAMAPATVSVIDPEQADQLQLSQDLGDVLVGTPGVTVTSNANGTRGVAIRGLNSGYTQVLMNGYRNYSSEAMFRGNDSGLSFIPTIAMESVEVIRGPMSSLYGADAMGGVVSVTTRKNSGVTEGAISVEGQYNAEDEGGNGQQIGVYFSTPFTDQLSWTVFGNYLHVDQTFYDQAPEFTKLRERDNYNIFNQLDYQVNDRNTLGLELQVSREDQKGDRVFNSREFEQQRETQKLSARHQLDLDNGFVKTNVFYDDYDIQYIDNPNSDIAEKTYGIDSQASLDVGEHTVSFGFDARNTELTGAARFFENQNLDRTQWGAFTEANLSLTDATVLTLSGRYDDDEIYGSEFTYRAYVASEVNDQWTLKGGHSTAFKAPQMVQTFDDYSAPVAGGGTIYGNSDLKAETGDFTELGAYFNHGDTSANLTVFYNEIDNLIQNESIGGNDFRYGNIGSATIKGAEFVLSQNFEQALLNLSYTYLDAIDNDTDEVLRGTSKHQATADVTWFATSELDIFARAHYRGEHVGELGRDLTPNDAYTTIDAGLRYSVNPATYIKFGVNNITNEDISDPNTPAYSEVIRGTTYYAGLVYDF